VVQKEKEDLDDVSTELELADEEDMIPYDDYPPYFVHQPLTFTGIRYKIGDSFISLPLPEVQELLSTNTDRIEKDVTALEEKLVQIREEMTGLKVDLYARFGRSINLET
jgi:prefoldin subunit 4